MSKLTKNQRLALEKIEAGKAYSLTEASSLVKEITNSNFDASVDVDVRLGVDPRKANQMVRGVVSLPNGTGKQVRVLALCTPDQEAAAKEAFDELSSSFEKDEIQMKDGDLPEKLAMSALLVKLVELGKVGPEEADSFIATHLEPATE